MQNEIGYSGVQTKTNQANSEREAEIQRWTYNSGNKQASVPGEVPIMHSQVCLFLRWSHRRSEIHSADSMYLATATTVLKQHVACCMCGLWLQMRSHDESAESCGGMRWIGGKVASNNTEHQFCLLIIMTKKKFLSWFFTLPCEQ